MIQYLISRDGKSTFLHNCRGGEVTETYSKTTAKRFTMKLKAEDYIKRKGLEDNYSVVKIKTGIDRKDG